MRLHHSFFIILALASCKQPTLPELSSSDLTQNNYTSYFDPSLNYSNQTNSQINPWQNSTSPGSTYTPPTYTPPTSSTPSPPASSNIELVYQTSGNGTLRRNSNSYPFTQSQQISIYNTTVQMQTTAADSSQKDLRSALTAGIGQVQTYHRATSTQLSQLKNTDNSYKVGIDYLIFANSVVSQEGQSNFSKPIPFLVRATNSYASLSSSGASFEVTAQAADGSSFPVRYDVMVERDDSTSAEVRITCNLNSSGQDLANKLKQIKTPLSITFYIDKTSRTVTQIVTNTMSYKDGKYLDFNVNYSVSKSN